ncbi:MAG: hypothetical protein ACE5GO_12080, partial [Anaerolineales bacterium]
NGDKITQRILFWVTKFPNQQINSEQIADALGVEEDVVLEVLAQLYEADIIEDIGWSAWEAFHALAKRCGYLGIPAKG